MTACATLKLGLHVVVKVPDQDLSHGDRIARFRENAGVYPSWGRRHHPAQRARIKESSRYSQYGRPAAFEGEHRRLLKATRTHHDLLYDLEANSSGIVGFFRTTPHSLC